MGMGVDVHGGDYTKAARRAVSDALRHSSLNFFAAAGKQRDDMHVEVVVGVADPAAVDVAAVAAPRSPTERSPFPPPSVASTFPLPVAPIASSSPTPPYWSAFPTRRPDEAPHGSRSTIDEQRVHWCLVAPDQQRWPAGGDEPPFLAQETTLVETTRARPRRTDQLADLVDRARPGLVALAVPAVVLVAGLVWFGGQSSDDPPKPEPREALAGPSAVGPLVQGVSAATDSVPEPPPPGDLEPAFQEPVPTGGFGPAAPPPTTRRATTAAPTTAAPTTTAPPTTTPPTTTPPTTTPQTTPPSTEPPPTEPPTTEPSDECQVTVGSTSLHSEPRRRSDVVAEIGGGTYPIVGFRVQWIQIDAGGTVGWVRTRHIDGFVGNCL